MASRNTEELLDFLSDKKRGERFDIQTSEYATNHTAPGYRFDFWSTAQAVRGLAKRGLIKAEYRWLYYEIEVL